MRKGKPPKKRPSATSRLSPEQRDRIDKIASNYGIEVPRPGSQLDRKYNKDVGGDAPPPTLYQRLASSVGVSTLDAAEKGVYVALGSLLLFVILGGLAISSEAFFKASGKPIPDGLDLVATQVESMFTPVLIVFLVLSSMLGLYKQSQLSSGATAYSEIAEDSNDK